MLKNTKKIITSKSVITFYPEKHGMNFCHKKYKIDAMFKNTKIIITSKSVTTFYPEKHDTDSSEQWTQNNYFTLKNTKWILLSMRNT